MQSTISVGWLPWAMVTNLYMLAGAVTGAVTTAVGYGNLFWVCAALSGCAAVLMAARPSLARAKS